MESGERERVALKRGEKDGVGMGEREVEGVITREAEEESEGRGKAMHPLSLERGGGEGHPQTLRDGAGLEEA